MAISMVDRRKLWGRSGMRCAICKTPLSQEHQLGESIIIGEEAHIVALSLDGPRGNSSLTTAERNRYSNLILLCAADHARIDKLPDAYPAERLLSIKAEHEAGVMGSTVFDRKKELTEEEWARLIDQLNEIVQWETWRSDVAPFFDPNSPWVRKVFINKLWRTSEWIFGRMWPKGHEELRSAIEAFGHLLADWMRAFEEHMESPDLDSHSAMTAKFYKIENYNPDLYMRLLKEYEYHIELLEDLALEATRYGNYLIHLVRDEIDPSFRFDEGLLLIVVPVGIFQYGLLKAEFSPSDFATGQPYKTLEAFKVERRSRDVYVGR